MIPGSVNDADACDIKSRRWSLGTLHERNSSNSLTFAAAPSSCATDRIKGPDPALFRWSETLIEAKDVDVKLQLMLHGDFTDASHVAIEKS